MVEPLAATPHLDAYVPEWRGAASQLRLVVSNPQPESEAPEVVRDRLASLRDSARRLISHLDRLEEMARTSGIDFEATIFELLQEEQLQLRHTLELSAHHEEHERLVREVERLRAASGKEPVSESDRRWVAEAAEMTRINREVYEAHKRCRQNLELLRDARLQEYASAWAEYLGNLESVTSSELAQAVRKIWGEVSVDLWAPQAAPRDDSFLMVWDRGRHHLEIEIFSSGTYDWFYRDRLEDTFQTQEGVPIHRTPSPLRAFVRKTKKG